MATTPTPEPGAWPRWRLLATLASVVLTALTLLIGLGLAVWTTLVTAPAPHPRTEEAAALPGEVRGDAYRDQLAAQPMLQVPAAAASAPDVSAALAPTLAVAVPDSVGPAGVPTGFPHTPEGAVAQLAAIEVTVVEAMNIPFAHQSTTPGACPAGPRRGSGR